MRKLKLQVQMTLDGFAAGPNGELDWMTFDFDDKLSAFVNELTDSCDTILLGRKMTDGFVNYWENVLEKPESPEYSFAERMVNYPKIVFSRTLEESNWRNTTLAKGELSEEVEALKKSDGKDIIVYGGANFVSNLIKENLIDEYNLFINPTAIGRGLEIFDKVEDKFSLRLDKSQSYDCGIVVNTYLPK
jgi:dihydrofolate reductase